MTEKEFLNEYNPGQYASTSAATDIVTLKMSLLGKPTMKVLLVKRKNHPAMGCWALPGGFISEESAEECARRKLIEKTGIKDMYLEQLYTFSDPKRDPRMRIISIAYMALLNNDDVCLKPSDSDMIADIKWFDLKIDAETETVKKLKIKNSELAIQMAYVISETCEKNGIISSKKTQLVNDSGLDNLLAFDHAQIIYTAIERIAGKCMYTPVIFNLMPDTFTIPQLQAVYEWFLKKKLHNTLFRKQMEDMIIAVDEKSKRSKRPAQMYKYKE